MATTFKWATPGTLTEALGSGLNSLADGAFSAASSVVDPTSSLEQYLILELNLASLSPVSGAFCDVWIEYAPDGTNHSDHGKALQTTGLLASFQLDTTASTAQRLPAVLVTVAPMKFKLSVRNKAGVALNASGNTLKYALLAEQGV